MLRCLHYSAQYGGLRLYGRAIVRVTVAQPIRGDSGLVHAQYLQYSPCAQILHGTECTTARYSLRRYLADSQLFWALSGLLFFGSLGGLLPFFYPVRHC